MCRSNYLSGVKAGMFYSGHIRSRRAAAIHILWAGRLCGPLVAPGAAAWGRAEPPVSGLTPGAAARGASHISSPAEPLLLVAVPREGTQCAEWGGWGCCPGGQHRASFCKGSSSLKAPGLAPHYLCPKTPLRGLWMTLFHFCSFPLCCRVSWLLLQHLSFLDL